MTAPPAYTRHGNSSSKMGQGNANRADPIADIHRRLAAAAVDYLVIVGWVAVVVAIGVGVRAFEPAVAAALFGTRWSAQTTGFVALTLPVGLYFAWSEAPVRAATVGKRVSGLRVTDMNGSRLSVGRSVLRTAVKLFPWELSHTAIWWFALDGLSASPIATVLLVVVWSLVAASVVSVVATGRAVYDFAAGTRVVRSPAD